MIVWNLRFLIFSYFLITRHEHQKVLNLIVPEMSIRRYWTWLYQRWASEGKKDVQHFLMFICDTIKLITWCSVYGTMKFNTWCSFVIQWILTPGALLWNNEVQHLVFFCGTMMFNTWCSFVIQWSSTPGVLLWFIASFLLICPIVSKRKICWTSLYHKRTPGVELHCTTKEHQELNFIVPQKNIKCIVPCMVLNKYEIQNDHYMQEIHYHRTLWN
jgi:hypothetical protein